MRLRLTENVFRNMLTEMVKDVLNEAKMSLDNVYNKYYNNIDKNIFLAAVNADPTSKRTDDGNIVGIGDYTKWILNLAKQKKWKPGDTSETIDSLTTYHKLKQQKNYHRIKEILIYLKVYLNYITFYNHFLQQKVEMRLNKTQKKYMKMINGW